MGPGPELRLSDQSAWSVASPVQKVIALTSVVHFTVSKAHQQASYFLVFSSKLRS